MSTLEYTCHVVTNGSFPWWNNAALLSWHRLLNPTSPPGASLSSGQYYTLLRHSLSLPTSFWLLTSTPLTLPANLYPAHTPKIPIYGRITYLDFPANLLELRLHRDTIKELYQAYDYFLEKSYPVRFYSAELRIALKARFLHRCESWVGKLGPEALKAATEWEIGCGNFGKWFEKLCGVGAISSGEGEFLTQYLQNIGMHEEQGKKRGRKEKRKEKEKKNTGVMEYIKGGFVPCLTDERNIWQMRFIEPKGWIWASYPTWTPTAPAAKLHLPSNHQQHHSPCLKRKFPQLCAQLGVASPGYVNHANQRLSGVRPANISEDHRGGKIRINKRRDGNAIILPSGHGQSFLTWNELLLRNSPQLGIFTHPYETVTGKRHSTDTESTKPTLYSSHKANTEWHPGVSKGNGEEIWSRYHEKEPAPDTATTLSGYSRSAFSSDYEEEEEDDNDDEEPVTKKPRLSGYGLHYGGVISQHDKTAINLVSSKSAMPTTLPEFFDAGPQSSPEQECTTGTTGYSSVSWVSEYLSSATQGSSSPTTAEQNPANLPGVSEAASNSKQENFQYPNFGLHNLRQGLPSPRLPLNSPLSYLKHRQRTIAARRRVFESINMTEVDQQQKQQVQGTPVRDTASSQSVAESPILPHNSSTTVGLAGKNSAPTQMPETKPNPTTYSSLASDENIDPIPNAELENFIKLEQKLLPRDLFSVTYSKPAPSIGATSGITKEAPTVVSCSPLAVEIHSTGTSPGLPSPPASDHDSGAAELQRENNDGSKKSPVNHPRIKQEGISGVSVSSPIEFIASPPPVSARAGGKNVVV